MLADRPLFTKEFNEITEFTPTKDSAYIYGTSGEPRSAFADELAARADSVRFYKVTAEDKYYFSSDIAGGDQISLRNKSSISAFLQSVSEPVVYIDITGLGHATWAALMRCAVEQGRTVRVVYLEPSSYLKTLEPKLGDIFDLSLRIQGIDQLPMFPTFGDFEEEKSCFVPLLGFEGTRFAHMFENVQPEDRKTFPIIGVPGFRQEYPFSAYLGNANPLQRSESFVRVRFAKSNCPFSLFYRLEELASEFDDHVMKLGLVGTKPHALGALLFAMQNESRSEIIYDHVLRKPGRTSGTDKCLVYAVSEFMGL
ncbi:hypothetical protein PVV74_19320 [Roseovarius sp. SK2]|uniref:hypothetical protein n=1 Tax=Roseovarius TaxID=74030 RepID=UPI000CDD98E7|nr:MULTISPECIES: hypothetical protein [Roseovarius]MDD9727608.1 hypothetical protein [Roseovarius sp. SK2]